MPTLTAIDYPLVTKHQVREHLNISPSTLKQWRLGHNGEPPLLTEGIHWVRMGSRDTRYNLALLHDFMVNRTAPDLHNQAIEHYLGTLPSGQRKRLRSGRNKRA